MKKIFPIGQLGLKCACFVGGTFGISRYLNNNWSMTKEKAKLITQVAVIAPCTLIFAASHVIIPKSIPRIIQRYFVSHPNDFRFLPLFGAGFAHLNIIHFGINMYAYNSFAEVSQLIGPFWTLWIFTTGVVGGSFLSCVFRSLRGLKYASVGASGGVSALIAFVTFIIPDLQMGIVFLPRSCSFEAWKGMGVFTVISITGMISKRFLPIIDHAGHLGGILSGFAIGIFARKKSIHEKIRNLLY